MQLMYLASRILTLFPARRATCAEGTPALSQFVRQASEVVRGLADQRRDLVRLESGLPRIGQGPPVGDVCDVAASVAVEEPIAGLQRRV